MVYKYHTNSMELNNVILTRVSPITKVSDTFSKREIVVETIGQRTQTLVLEVHNDKCNAYESIPLNSIVDLRIDLRGHVWTNPQGVSRVINTIVAWKVQPKFAVQPPVPPAQVSAPAKATVTEVDDLPF